MLKNYTMRRITCLLMGVVALSMTATDYLFVRQKSGDTKIALSGISHITFPETGGVVINNTDGTTETYANENLYSLRFNNNISSTSEILENKNVEITHDGTTVTVNVEGLGISVYALDGSLVAQGLNSSADISYLQPGLYIIKAGSVTAKIVKK